MLSSLKNLYSEFSLKEKRRLNLIVLVVVITGILQVIGIATIFPFIGVVDNPEIIRTNQYLSMFKEMLHISTDQSFLIVLGVIVLLSLMLTNSFLAFSSWIMSKFIVTTTNQFSHRLLSKYLNEDYLFHLSRNSSELIKNINWEVSRVVNGGIRSILEIFSKGFAALCILILLIAVDPLIAFLVMAVIGGAYSLIFLLFRKKMIYMGKSVSRLVSERYKIAYESLGGIKELMLTGRQSNYLKRYDNLAESLNRIEVFQTVIGDIPRYLLETVAFGGILLMAIYVIATQGNTDNLMPTLALYGFAGYRLMPSLQAVFKAVGRLHHELAAIDIIYSDLHSSSEIVCKSKQSHQSISFDNQLKLENISFSYPATLSRALTNISFTIKKNASIGIVGTSGSGKSTLVDIILGLLHPSEGRLLVDGKLIKSDVLHSWQKRIGYVPQSIFLADTTIIENIAFGIPKDSIDFTAVERAAQSANIHDFITSNLDEGYETVVGERGIRLSGGQRQRIGIARALYHSPDLLIFDEATSALDGQSEKVVMEAVEQLTGQVTIIMIAHRLSTVEKCNSLIWLEHGQIKLHGTFQDLFENDQSFRDFARPSRLGSQE